MNTTDHLALRLREHFEATADANVPVGFVDAVLDDVVRTGRGPWPAVRWPARLGMRPAERGRPRPLLSLALVLLVIAVVAGMVAVGARVVQRNPDLLGVPRIVSTGPMVHARADAAAVRLADGRVLVAGGRGNGETTPIPLDTAEIFDPSTGTWTLTGHMSRARVHAAAALLPDGRVLVTGGHETPFWNVGLPPGTSTAEVWDPATEAFSSTDPMLEGRAGHTATTLDDGRVIVIGGVASRGVDVWRTLASAELWDPRTGTFSPANPLLEARHEHLALPRGDGLLVVGGSAFAVDDGGGHLGQVVGAESYEPDGTGHRMEILHDVNAQAGTILPDGRIALCCAWRDTRSALIVLPLDDERPPTEITPTAWRDRPALSVATMEESADGRVVVDWRDDGRPGHGLDAIDLDAGIATSILRPATDSGADGVPGPDERDGEMTVRLADGRILVAGGMRQLTPEEAEQTGRWHEVPLDSADLIEIQAAPSTD